MRRRHLFEFGDQPWLPSKLRDALTAYLVAAYRFTPFPRLWAQHLAQVLTQCRLDEVVDLGSGSGGPVPLVMREMAALGCHARFTLTDLYPPASRRETPELRYWPEPVDATRVPASLRGVRTMFSSFHHLRPSQAHQVLRNAFDQRQPTCIFEGTTRAPAAISTTPLIPLLVLLLTPSVRPLSLFQFIA